MDEFVGGVPLAQRLSVTPAGGDRFRARLDAGPARSGFGGQVAGQSVLAAGATVEPARPLRSLHACFLLPTRSGRDIEYRVERVRDGRSTTVRRVEAHQDGERVFLLVASFQDAGADTHAQVSAPRAAPPDRAPLGLAAPLEVRPLRWAEPDGDPAPGQLLWLRCPTALPADPLLHSAALLFACDLTLGWSPWKALGVHRVTEPMYGASLDHAMWFHAPVELDDWLLVDQRSQAVAADRGLALASVFDGSGRLVSTAAQEGVMRGIAETTSRASGRERADTTTRDRNDVFVIA